MKKSFVFSLLAFVLIVFASCQKDAEVMPNADVAYSSTKEAAVAGPIAGGQYDFYALVVNVKSVPLAGLSYIYGVNAASGAYTYISLIMYGNKKLTHVTGITLDPTNSGYVYATTGAASNYPRRLWRVTISTGVAALVAPTTRPGGAAIFIKDIEGLKQDNGAMFAIEEGTSQVVKVSYAGVCTNFAVVPSKSPNGLTIDSGNFIQVVSTNANAFTGGLNFGDMNNINSGTGVVGPNYTYNCTNASPNWIGGEAGLHWYSTSGRYYVANDQNPNPSYITYNAPPMPPVLVTLNVAQPTHDFTRKQ